MVLNAQIRTYTELREDLSAEQRAVLVDDIWRRARRKRVENCPVMPSCCKPKVLPGK